MDAAALKDRAIVAVSGAARLGKVSEVLFETDPLRVSAIKASGDEGEFIIPLDRVSRFGPDAVMVENTDAKELARATSANERTLAELTQLKVVDEDGRSLGTVRSIEFDPDSGKVESVHAGESGMLGMGGMRATIRASGIRGVGTDLLTVASSEAQEPAPSSEAHEPVERDAAAAERDAGAAERRRTPNGEPNNHVIVTGRDGAAAERDTGAEEPRRAE